MAKRFYQIAFELGIAPRALIGELSAHGLSVGNQMVVVADTLEQRIRSLFADARPPSEEEAAFAPSGGDVAVAEYGEPVEEVAEQTPELLTSDEAATAELETPEPEIATPPPEEPAIADTAPSAVAVEAAPAPHAPASEPTTAPAAPAAVEPVAADRTAAPVAGHDAPAGVRTAAHAPAPAGTRPAQPPQGGVKRMHQDTRGVSGSAGTGGHAGTAHSASAHAAAAAHAAAPHTGLPPRPRVAPPPINATQLGYKNLAPKGPAAKGREGGELIPTIDPRAGRLLKEAPKAGVPGVTRTPPSTRPAPGSAQQPPQGPAIARPAPAPGARRDGRSRGPEEKGAEKHGKQTFQLRSRKRTPSKPVEPVEQVPRIIEVTPPIPLKAFSEVSGIKISDIVKTMFVNHKQLMTPNSMLTEDVLVTIGVEFDKDIKFVKRESNEDVMLREAEQQSKPESLAIRPPVVVVMGHVDHGKTSLLDFVRKADVAAHEAGGITQHIGAYQVKVADGRKITFFDTPGHSAFTEMRRRGAKVTDLVVLVVAADDGVMPQTIEAIDHAKAAEVPITVAITKSDKVGFKPESVEKIKQQLSQHGILASGWGGDVECFPVSTVGKEAGRGVDKLLEHLLLVADVEDLRSDPTRPAQGTIIEAENNPGRGVLATLLVQQGTLRRGDALVAGRVWGRVRAMRDDHGETVEEAPPGTPIEITGLDEVPEVGKPFFVRAEANEAREIAEQRRGRDRELELAAQAKPASLEGLFSAIEQGKVKTLKVILKTDVQGSLEAIRARLDAIGNAEVKVQIIRAGVGAVSESDVTMAATYDALVLGFHVVADETARMKAKSLGIDIRMYRIIYELEEEIRAMLETRLAPESREAVLGHAEVLQIFKSTKLGNIAGCRVRDGVIRRDAKIRLSRDGVVVWEGAIGSLRREKDDAKEVKEGFECGIRLEGYDDLKQADVIEAYSVEQVKRTLES